MLLSFPVALYFISLKCFSRLHGITTSAFGGLAGSSVDKSFNGVVQTISVDCYLFNWKPSICHIFDGCADILYKDQTSDATSKGTELTG